jgi:hypothetical protein
MPIMARDSLATQVEPRVWEVIKEEQSRRTETRPAGGAWRWLAAQRPVSVGARPFGDREPASSTGPRADLEGAAMADEKLGFVF